MSRNRVIFNPRKQNKSYSHNNDNSQKVLIELYSIKRQLNHIKMALGFTKESSQ